MFNCFTAESKRSPVGRHPTINYQSVYRPRVIIDRHIPTSWRLSRPYYNQSRITIGSYTQHYRIYCSGRVNMMQINSCNCGNISNAGLPLVACSCNNALAFAIKSYLTKNQTYACKVTFVCVCVNSLFRDMPSSLIMKQQCEQTLHYERVLQPYYQPCVIQDQMSTSDAACLHWHYKDGLHYTTLTATIISL